MHLGRQAIHSGHEGGFQRRSVRLRIAEFGGAARKGSRIRFRRDGAGANFENEPIVRAAAQATGDALAGVAAAQDRKGGAYCILQVAQALDGRDGDNGIGFEHCGPPSRSAARCARS